MKQIITYVFFMLSTVIMAQSGMVNTTTITVDKKIDGKIVQEVIVIEGDGADEKLKELEKDKSVVNINVEKRVEMRSDDPDSEEVKKMRKEIEVEIREIEKVTGKNADRREENVQIEITANDKKEIKKYKVKIIEDGKEEVIEWNGEGEMPSEMKKVMDGTEVIINTKDELKVNRFKIVNSDEVMIEERILLEKNNNRGQIGVMITDAEGGVEISEFTENSMAKSAGLELGDIIIGVNEKRVINIQALVDTLTPFKPGDKVSINFTRGDSILTKEVELAKRN